MIHAQNGKVVLATPPAAIVNNAAITVSSVDTKGWDYSTWSLYLGATDIALTVFKLRESDDDSTYSDVSGADFSVSPLTLPSATDDNHIFRIFVDLKNGARKRYQKLSVTVGSGSTGAYSTVVCELFRAKNVPSTATLRGLTQQAFV